MPNHMRALSVACVACAVALGGAGDAAAEGAASSTAMCAPPAPHPGTVRTAGALRVTSPPARHTGIGLRLRSQTNIVSQPATPAFPGSPWVNAPRQPDVHEWTGMEVPDFVPLSIGLMTLEILDPVPGGYMALYRDVTWTACSAGSSKNCDAEARIFDCAGRELVAVPLNPLLSRRDHLEVQDARFADGTLYFNEACATYSREANGRCSSVVAVDVATKRVSWRTPFLQSNNELVLVGDYLVTAYGFTGEPGSVRVIRRSDGKTMDRQPIPGSAFEKSVHGRILSVELYYDYGRRDYDMVGFDGPAPKLVPRAVRRDPRT